MLDAGWVVSGASSDNKLNVSRPVTKPGRVRRSEVLVEDLTDVLQYRRKRCFVVHRVMPGGPETGCEIAPGIDGTVCFGIKCLGKWSR